MSIHFSKRFLPRGRQQIAPTGKGPGIIKFITVRIATQQIIVYFRVSIVIKRLIFMDILKIPFHRHLQIEKSRDNDEFVFRMDERPEHLNHLGTIHACVQLTLAEATSGEFLRIQFNEMEGKVVPVIRKTEVKYSTPANGSLFSKASLPTGIREKYINEYKSKGRCIIPVKVELYNSENKRTLLAVFDWFITNIPT